MSVSKNKKLLLFILISILLIAGCSEKSSQEKKTEHVSDTMEKSKDNVPTLFIHGYQGGKSSFGGMLTRLAMKEKAAKSIQIIVDADGNITEKGKWRDDKPPMIQVIFEDNTNGEGQQAEWLQQILHDLKERHQVTAINFVGHSMGGVSILTYLTSDFAANDSIRVEKFIAIGAPFNEFVEDNQTTEEITKMGPTVLSPRYVAYKEGVTNYPRDCQFLNIAGDIESDGQSDGTVPVSSVASINYLFEQNGLPYQFECMTGKGAQHSALHENKKVDQRVASFLWHNP